MWFPQSAEELLAALPDAVETAHIDYKRELPPRKENVSIAVDVAAMSVEGGVLIYGVDEDKERTTFTPHPIPLLGQAERIDSVVRSYVEGLVPSIWTYPDPDPVNEGAGYVVVVVPPSPLAPHNVEGVGMFGRGSTGNRRLTQGDIDRLYSRRRLFEVTGQQRIEKARAFSDLKTEPGEFLGVLRLVIAPLVADETIRVAAGVGDDGNDVIRLSVRAREEIKFKLADHYDISHLSRASTQTLARGVRLATTGTGPEEMFELDVLNNGTVLLAFGGILHPLEGGKAVFDAALAQMVAHTLAIAGFIYEAAHYNGFVDLAVSVDGGAGAVSSWWYLAGTSRPASRQHGVLRGDEIIESSRTMADQLLGKRAVDTARALVAPILRAVRPSGWPDPLTLG